MTLSELCIRRPVMTVLLTLAIVAGGLAAYRLLPVAALPRVDFPVITVTAVLPGAAPETMATSVAQVLEREFTTIAGITNITSTNALGSTQITLEFDLDRDIDAAAQDVQAAISRAQRRLPEDMTTPPSYRKVNPADQPILFLALSSATLPLSTVNDYAENVVSPRVSTLTGVAQVQVYGIQRYAVRVQLNPDALAARGVGIDEVQQALVNANTNTPLGTLSGPAKQVTLQATGQLPNAAAFRPIIVAYRNGAPVRLGDIANVIDSVENDRVASWRNGTRAIVLAVQRQPDANTVEVVDRVKALLPTFRTDLPPSVAIDVLIDRSVSIRAAVEDVQFTLMLTIGLVLLVIFLFLRRLSATLIPALALPISLIGTFGAMYLLGYSIDNISLLGLTLSVGLVVDDAIVMLENIVRLVERGMSPFAAALQGAREIGFTILSITLSLVAVFIPILLMGGVVGRVFHEFAMVVTLAIAFSAFVSLTLTPMLCSRLLRLPPPGERPGRFERGAERVFDGMLHLYDITLRWVLRHRPVMMLVLLATVAGTAVLFQTIPKSFFPVEDTGQLSITTEAAQDISFAAMVERQQQVAAILQADPFVESVMSSVGAIGQSATVSNGRLFIGLKPRGQRPPVEQVIQQLRRKLAGLPGIRTYIQPVQNLQLTARASRSLYQYTLRGFDLGELDGAATRMLDALRQVPQLQDVTSDLQLESPQATIVIDRDRASTLGIPVEEVRSALYSGFGTRQVSTIYTAVSDYAVIMELQPQFQSDAGALSRLHVRSNSGALVPLGAFARIERTAGPLTVNHQSQLPAVTISFNLAPGVSLGDALAAVGRVEREAGLPATVTSSFQGSAQFFQQALAGQGLLLLAAVVVIYIVLGILYESYLHPVTILSGLPSAAVGALLTLMLFGQDLSVIAMIGILMLIGIVKKNAIMMIDFALAAQREEGMKPAEAIYQACRLRFRPIMMTTMAAIMGTLPIALGQGASAELRQPLGIAVVGGLVVSQLLTLFITPVLYLYLEGLRERTLGLFARRRPAGPVVPPDRALQPGED